MAFVVDRVVSLPTSPTSCLSSQDFYQDINRAKRQAENGPVIITDCGRLAYVLLRYEDYACLAGNAPGMRALLAQQVRR